MNIDASIFKAYDIRGVYNKNLFPETASAIARAFVKYVQPTEVLIGIDGRTSGPALKKAVVETLLNLGVSVIDIGQVSSDMYYYACAQKKLPGIMITASHNPSEYNGFKMVRDIPYFLTGDEGISQMLGFIQNDDLPSDLPANQSDKKGTLSTWEIMDEYLDYCLSLVDTSSFAPMTIVADPANGMVGPILDEFIKRVPQIKVIPLFFDVDGSFPNHEGDPLLAENRIDLENAVREHGADFGVAFDPDGDRFFVVDGKGRLVPGDFMTALLAQHFLQNNPGASIVYDIRASKIVPDFVEQAGGTALYNRVGHSYIKQRMSTEGALFAGEVSGHYYFRDFFLCDSGFVSMLYFLEYLSQSDQSITQIADELTAQYHISGEINNEVADVPTVLAKLEERYKDEAQEILHVDGVTLECGAWRCNVRGSNTQPLIRLCLEADSKELMEQKRDEVLALIRG